MSISRSETEVVWATHLDSLCVELEAIFGYQKLLHIFALITLKLDHLAHFAIGDDGAIASYHILAIRSLSNIAVYTYQTFS